MSELSQSIDDAARLTRAEALCRLLIAELATEPAGLRAASVAVELLGAIRLAGNAAAADAEYRHAIEIYYSGL